MKSIIPILILTALSSVVFADESMASQQIGQVLKDTEVRQKQMLKSMLHTLTHWRVDFTFCKKYASY